MWWGRSTKSLCSARDMRLHQSGGVRLFPKTSDTSPSQKVRRLFIFYRRSVAVRSDPRTVFICSCSLSGGTEELPRPTRQPVTRTTRQPVPRYFRFVCGGVTNSRGAWAAWLALPDRVQHEIFRKTKIAASATSLGLMFAVCRSRRGEHVERRGQMWDI